MMPAIGNLLLFLLDVYFWIVIVEVAVSWLIVFEVINIRSPQAANLVKLLRRATDPVMGRIRKFVPAIGGIDVTPIIVIFGIYMLQSLVVRIFIVSAYM